MKFTEMLNRSIETQKSLLCVGIDPQIEKIPRCQSGMVDFCKKYIDETAEFAATFKIQFAYF